MRRKCSECGEFFTPDPTFASGIPLDVFELSCPNCSEKAAKQENTEPPYVWAPGKHGPHESPLLNSS